MIILYNNDNTVQCDLSRYLIIPYGREMARETRNG